MAKIATELDKRLSRSHRVLTLSPLQATRFGFWRRIREFAPDVIHYIPGPSLKSFLLIKLLSNAVPEAKTIMSAPLPQLPSYGHRLLPALSPDVILAQSRRMADTFKSWGLAAMYLPVSGVDVDRFLPVTYTRKEALRNKYEIDKERFVALHVGHIKSKRNVQAMISIQSHGIQTVVVGSPSTGTEPRLRDQLLAAGVSVITQYTGMIEELYQLSDCYVFPTPTANGSASIEIPLSILEAAACNLPIVSIRYGGLAEIFEGMEGVSFVDLECGLSEAVNATMSNRHKTNTRAGVAPLAWESISQDLNSLYGVVVRGG